MNQRSKTRPVALVTINWIILFTRRLSFLIFSVFLAKTYYQLKFHIACRDFLRQTLFSGNGRTDSYLLEPGIYQPFSLSTGSNKYCLDVNYGGVLIIWDRIFGTFRPETDKVEIVYGLIYNQPSFNPLLLQVG